ncbi:hypothetical protein [Cupriavidus sp. DL-D2]|uniref:hypothetical protein n=1 Tax=Cupriavidus sp. DL-D2 TaxID=3144974 RepID=UPI003213B83E
MSTLADRLKEAMSDMPDVKAVDIARACGIKSASIVDWQTGRTKKMEGSNLLATAELLRVNPWWLATGRGNKRSAYSLDPGHGVVQGNPTQSALVWPFSASLADYEKLSPAQKTTLDNVVSAYVLTSLAEGRATLSTPTPDGTLKASARRVRKVANS